MQKYIERYSGLLATLLLGLMFALGFYSMRGDAAIVDEIAHIPAGYSYLHFGDFRLNPEHPPLLKDMAGLPLQFLHLKFPSSISAWTTEPNGQWETGWNFIYHIGNNADQVIFWARIPILILALILGLVLFIYSRRKFGSSVALLTLFFYCLSPNIIAHARFVTTDLGITAFIFFAFMSYIAFLEKPSLKTGALASVFFALAQVAKFSAVLLIPLWGVLALVAVLVKTEPYGWWPRAKIYIGGLLAIGIAAFLMVWAFYIPHTINMPEQVQDKLIEASLSPGYRKTIGNQLLAVNNIPIAKPMVQYVLGLLMVFNRVSSGNTTYFLGQVTNQSFASYFPVTFGIKTQIGLLILIALALLTATFEYFAKSPWRVWKKFSDYARLHLVELGSLLFIALYSYVSITGNLNLGIRHLLPIMPFVFLMVAKRTVAFFGHHSGSLKTWVLAILLGWYGLATIFIYPSYVAYFNEFIGGPSNADKYVSDSSVDWGQDLKRLKTYVDARPEIDKIAVDYFGGGDPQYYFCDRAYRSDGSLIADASGYDCSESKFVDWHAQFGIPTKANYIAVSETFLMNDIYLAPQRGDVGYSQLRSQTPIAKIGYSIYVYKLR